MTDKRSTDKISIALSEKLGDAEDSVIIADVIVAIGLLVLVMVAIFCFAIESI